MNNLDMIGHLAARIHMDRWGPRGADILDLEDPQIGFFLRADEEGRGGGYVVEERGERSNTRDREGIFTHQEDAERYLALKIGFHARPRALPFLPDAPPPDGATINNETVTYLDRTATFVGGGKQYLAEFAGLVALTPLEIAELYCPGFTKEVEALDRPDQPWGIDAAGTYRTIDE